MAILSVLFAREAGRVTHGVVLLWEGLGMKSRAPPSTYTMTGPRYLVFQAFQPSFVRHTVPKE